MTEMHCNNCQRWLHGYLDDELDTTTATLVAEHLKACTACQQKYEAMKRLTVAVQDHAPYYTMPAAQVREVLHRAVSEAPRANIWQKINEMRSWLIPGVSMAALATAAVLLVNTPVQQNLWLDEAVSEHIRSLMPGHLYDVESSDRHTVKPWFTGKLDFSPPVYDFSSQGYQLLGGRLDYLQHQTIAALSYRHNKHIINLFVMQTGDGDAIPQNLSERGYNIVSWKQNHMRFVAVSDLNKDELNTLSQFVQQAM
jgi:anti-sigma factor RsiW